MVWKLIPTCSSYMPSAIVSNYRMMSKIKDTDNRLHFLVKQRKQLNLRENLGGSSNRSSVISLPTTSLVDESNVYGRDEDKKHVIKLLFGDEARRENVSLIPIVGMGGIGKTTLAQLVYNDEDIKQNFHVRAWVCVSEEFDVISITKMIYDEVIGSSDQSKGSTFNMQQVSLQNKLAKTKFLIVLDDVWNENYGKWDHLFRPFQFGLPGSRIIVTTRNENVASVVGSPKLAYHMKLLTDQDCLSLLARHARTSLDENTEFTEVGLGLVKKCKGLPLAAKMLGGLLRTKESREEWEDVLNSKIWYLPEQSNILPVLRLSYHHLPSHLKHLFAYCSIFPKDYEFNKSELVLLWMGEGFLERPNERKRKEDLGLEYFNDLLSRSFFQRLSGSESNFVMHDLINDLAHFVAGGTCYHLDEKMDTNQEYCMPENTRHGSFLRHRYEVFTKFKAFYRVQGLRTFLPMPVHQPFIQQPYFLSNKILAELVPKLHRLRVMSLNGYSSIKELPSSICNLIHLRYLNLSGTSIMTLPESVGDLFHLQTLSLRKCLSTCKLPPALGNLSNLRHLDNSHTGQLKDMPVEIGKLRNLQTLPKIVLSKVGGLGLRELRDLKLLRGTLSLLELQNVTDIEDVKDASLRCKNELDELQLTWGNDIDASQDRSSEEEVIELLQPHEGLRTLKVEFYGGSKFPSWIGDPAFHKLSSVRISSCSGCTFLPPLGQLPELKHLQVSGMPKVKCIGNEFYGSGVVVPFPNLKTLTFSDMPDLEKWTAFGDGEDVQILFPHLQELAIIKCGKLTDVSPLNFPVLRELHIVKSSKVLLESFCNLNSLIDLRVNDITGMPHLPSELMESLTVLEVLRCSNCNELLSLWPNEILPEHLTHLRRLVIAGRSQLVSLGQGDQQLPCNLEVLELFGCDNLVSLPNDLSNLRSLKELIIGDCIKFINFPENGIPPTLKRLVIRHCVALESLPTNISNLERLEIEECSSLTKWVTGHFPGALKKLSIQSCTQLEPVSDMMFPQVSSLLLEDLNLYNWHNSTNLVHHLHGFSHLVELYLCKCHGLECFPEQGLPPSLRVLIIALCAHLTSLPDKLQTMKFLESLAIDSCPRLDNFPEFDLPPNLSSLSIRGSKRLKPLTQWGLHRLTSLQEFSISGGFEELELLGDNNCLFPPSLTNFCIDGFPRLRSLGNVLENLKLLQCLSVMNCANVRELPSESLLEKLWQLAVRGCPLLEQRCRKDKGDYWPKIAGIPRVFFD
ncbi:Apoptotic ATPase [Handroanthus impetiginosus]|uniref:Apoptotic ATPase n=1 Tax=Handroanthus impetiginosus TaxID=429701 RepID=A0A2G9I200_9LAMI|nr:Apoptotic ATPase [Handroanthus impetiginosus]